MKTDNDRFTPSWDLYSLAIIFLFLFFQIIRFPAFPLFIDTYYHLSVMQGFNTAGGYVANSFWEYAPVGRPHLYPPLIHIIMLLLHKAGLGKIIIARLFDCLIVPLGFFSIWFVLRGIFNRRRAFFALLIAASVYSFYLSLIVTLPATLSVLCGLWSFYFLEKDKRIAGTVFLIFSFYLHVLMPWIITASFLIYSLLNRERATRYVVAISFALLAASPILARQYLNRANFRFLNVNENYSLEINIPLIILALFGLWVSFARKGRDYFFTAFFIGFTILGLAYRYRYLCAQGALGFILPAALPLDYLYGKVKHSRKAVAYLVLAVVLFFISSPSLLLTEKKSSLSFLNSTFMNLITEKGRANDRSVFYPKFYDEIIASIRQESSEDGIIYSNFNYFAGILGVLSGRATSSAMLVEIKPRHDFNQVKAATLIIWLKDPNAQRKEPYGLINTYRLDKIKETELAFIYKNPEATGKRVVPKPVVSNPVLFIAFFMAIAVIVLDVSRKKV